MRISYDPAKRAATIKRRGLDFADAAEVFAGNYTEALDDRHAYGEAATSQRDICGAAWWCWCGRREAMGGTSSR